MEELIMKEKIIKIEMRRPSITGFIVGFSVSNDTTSEKFYKKLFECTAKLGCDLSSDTTIITLTYPNDDKTTIINVRFTYYAEYDSNGISWSNSILKNIDNENELAVSYNNPSGGCVYLTKNKSGFIERHKIKLLSEIFEILCDDDEVVKQSSGYNYIKPVNIADIDSSASETKEENIKTNTTDNRFVYDELIWNPDVNIDVIRFISQYNNDDEFSKNAHDYDYKYSYHFAKLLKSIFDRGTVCYSTCYNKFVWCDDDGLSYCVKGNICMLRSGKLIPEDKIPKTIIEFFKNPNCEDYYEKLHIFGYYMKSLLSE